MTYGLRVWDGTGGLMLDVTDRITRFVGTYSFYIAPFQTSVDISVPGASPDTWFAVSEEAHASVISGVVRLTRIYGDRNRNPTYGTVLVFCA